jgi:pimeloyl-ACP methyl ester carboxylesterase
MMVVKYNYIPLLILAMLLPGIQGCAPGTIINLSRNVEELEVTHAVLGEVSGEIKNASKVRIFIKEKDGNPKSEVKNMGVVGGNNYIFVVRQNRVYLLFAYEDRNNNKTYEPGEPADMREIKTDLTALKGTAKGFRKNLKLSTTNRLPHDSISINTALIKSRSITPVLRYGEVIDIEDAKFSQAYGEKGLWQPMDFINEVGIGVYFLETYRPDKIPVLFVTGAGGYPQSWQKLLDRLDLSKYQPWFYYYASGDRLDRSANILNEIITALHKKYNYPSLYVTAHSMGGLVAREFIIKNIYENNNDYIKLFISISTPWSGHEAAAKGVRRLPVFIPSWIDMQTNSRYIKNLYRKKIADRVDYYLFASYKGSKNLLSEYNDGVVSVTSQLRLEAQDEANKVIGLNEDHVGILSSNEMIKRYNNILKLMESE